MAEGVAVREIPWALGLDPRAWWRLVVEALAWPPDLIHAHNSHAVTLAVWALVERDGEHEVVGLVQRGANDDVAPGGFAFADEAINGFSGYTFQGLRTR